ncbi:hypothetical protein [Aeromicrobium massiliense]|uniref:hypothetical protein n=1 Tax=Aeromicrobium massiliense TaxID=1464554 RepID=UPI0002FF7AFD|nr:hypothetical protein [Aeromicrobium massiliense]
MRTQDFGRRLAAAATTTVLSLGLLAGCGGQDDPLAPLYETLGQIDDSIVAGEYDQARDQVADLLDQVSQARTDGDMTKPAATRIRDAAKALRSELAEAEKAEEEPTGTPTTPAPTTDSSQDEADEKEREKAEREAEKQRQAEERQAEKERREREKQNTPTPAPTTQAPTTDAPTTEPPASDSGTPDGDGDGEG